jgi:TPR repeat protein/serine/threonine protein kinase
METGGAGSGDAVKTGPARTGESLNALPEGARVAEFEIRRVLGEGGFGVVYLAFDHSLERHIALKEYLPSAFAFRKDDQTILPRSQQHRDTFEAGLRSFLQEARLLAQFDHPALVKVHRFWEAHGTAYMAMAYYEGVTFRDVIRKNPGFVTDASLKALVTPLLDAVELLHAKQCYHRDIAPDNIIIQRSGAPVLLDFGAARRVIGDMTQALTAVLKPGFAPVEQYAEEGGLVQGPWTDVYGFAAMMYSAITGKPPQASASRALNDHMVPLRRAPPPGFDPEFLRGIDAGLAVRPEDRPQSIAAFRDALGLATELDSAKTIAIRRPRVVDEDDEGEPAIKSGRLPEPPTRTEPPRTAGMGRSSAGDGKVEPVLRADISDRTLPPSGVAAHGRAELSERGDSRQKRGLSTWQQASLVAMGMLALVAVTLAILSNITGMSFDPRPKPTPEMVARTAPPSSPVPAATDKPANDGAGSATSPAPAAAAPDASNPAPVSVMSPLPGAGAPPTPSAVAESTAPAAASAIAAGKNEKPAPSANLAPPATKMQPDKAGPAANAALTARNAPGAGGAPVAIFTEPATAPASAPPPAPVRDAGPTDARMQYDLALSLESGRGATKDLAEAAKWYRRSAEQGFAPAQTSLAYLYERGLGVQRDYAEAVKWYGKAAEQGSAQAQGNLGYMYERGFGLARDYEEAVKWYTKAAEQGVARSQYNLGYMYANGNGVARNDALAVQWYSKAAEQGFAPAQANLGYMFESGRGVTADAAGAVNWYRKAAEQGNALGQNNLGSSYLNGKGVGKDEAEAVKWYRRAAEQGLAVAQTNLGNMYRDGAGVAKDEAEALKWYRRASDQGDADASNAIKRLTAGK